MMQAHRSTTGKLSRPLPLRSHARRSPEQRDPPVRDIARERKSLLANAPCQVHRPPPT